MNIDSKEEILMKEVAIYPAMDEYAKRQAIECAKWVTGQINPLYICNGNGTWSIIKPQRSPTPNEIISDEQLYELFLKHQSEQP